jgi:hypothetical protein
VAGVVLVIVIVLIAVGVSSCQSSARKSALQDYAHSVNSLINRSDQTGSTLFGALSSGVNASNVTNASNSINTARQSAENVLSDARGVSVPSAARTANSRLVFALQQRLDGITNIATEIQPALGTSVNRDAVNQIAGEMARFYSSDVVYKDYVAPALVSALHANHIAVGGADGVVINGHQFLPSIDWLQPQFVAAQLNVTLPSGSGGGKGGKTATGLHGHALTSVSVAGTTLVPGATNTVAASPTPTFHVSFENGGNFNETDVRCTVTVTGKNVSGTKIVPETFSNKPATCDVTLNTSPPAGSASVVVTIAKVPGEKNTANNTQTYPVTFN